MSGPGGFDRAFERVKELAAIFKQNEQRYQSAGYSEAQARKDFIDKFWMALGWDVDHETQTDPYKQEVKVERGVAVSEMRKRADYAFLAANFRDVRFFVEAKKPHAGIDNPDYYFQIIRYGWNSRTPLAVLMDFEEFRVLDCRYKPDIRTALGHCVLKYHYDDYADEEEFRTLYYLFSRQAVLDGSIQQFAKGLPKLSRKKAQRDRAEVEHQDIDQSFLQELDEYREELARAFKRKNPELDGPELTEVTQRTLDRLVFMRFLEDKLIEADPLIEDLHKRGKSWQNFISTSRRLDRVYNGIIFKEHNLLDKDSFKVDEKAFDRICQNLSHAYSPYDFNAIPIHILGSIYERFLGKVIVATDKRARVEEKPEVRKAGGVYYTPEYIVRYIVDKTVGKLIEGKAPKEIAEMCFADIACGSGSFLLGVYDTLLGYHTAYYNRNKRTRAEGLKARCIEREDGTLQLSLWQKRQILLDNIYGVDIDPQAVEVAQLSLYLKLLEDETTGSAHRQQLELREALLPSLNKNIICGNSLIGWDIMEGKLFETIDERKLNPMNFEDAFPEVIKRGGFDAIVGNPPYIRIQTLQETAPLSVEYFSRSYEAASKGNYDIYVVFVERALGLLNQQGKLGYILPHKFFNAQYGQPLRKLLSEGKHMSHVVHFGHAQVFKGATTYTCLLFAEKSPHGEMRLVRVNDLNGWQEKQAGDEATIRASGITPSEWNFTVGRDAGLLERLRAVPTKLAGIAERMAQGIRTSANEVYVLDLIKSEGDLITAFSKQLGENVVLERSAVLLFLQGREIKPFRVLPSGKIVVFPYRIRGNHPELINESMLKESYPRTYDYLSMNKTYLKKREKGRFSGLDWYAYGRAQNIDLMLLPKILVPDIADKASFALDASGEYAFTSGYGITFNISVCESPKYILGLLNSMVLDFFLKRVSTTLRGGFFRYFTQFIEQLPIRTIDFSDNDDKAIHDRMVQLVDQMIEAKKQLAAARSERDRTFYESKCAAIDRQIDELVYQLYDLTPDEIAIVEAGGK